MHVTFEVFNVCRNEQLLKQGLEINDFLQSVLSKYDAVVSGAPLAVEAPVSDIIKAPREAPAVNHLHPLKIMTLLMKRKMSLRR